MHVCTFTKQCHSQTIQSSEAASKFHETFLAPSADSQTRDYDKECTNQLSFLGC